MKNQQNNTSAQSALLRTANGGDTLETNSLCCAAAGIIAPPSATAEALIPHEKLRGAALSDATLIAQARPLAQPALGYTPASNAVEYPPQSKPGQRYWPADLTNVRPEEWAVMSPKHVAEFAGVTEVWLLLEAAQKRIAELAQGNRDLQTRQRTADELLDSLAWSLAEGVLTYKPENPEHADWFAETEVSLELVHQYQLEHGAQPLKNPTEIGGKVKEAQNA